SSSEEGGELGGPNVTDLGLRDRRDEKLQRAVGATKSGRAATVVASDTGRKRNLSRCRTNLDPRVGAAGVVPAAIASSRPQAAASRRESTPTSEIRKPCAAMVPRRPVAASLRPQPLRAA